MSTIHFETLGCRLNQDETEGAARCFSEAGFAVDLEGLTAASAVREDTILGIINTCTVTGKAEQKARRVIRLMLEKLPSAVILVTGCYAELDAAEIRRIDEKRICVLAGRQKYLLASLAVEMAAEGSLCVAKGLFSAEHLDGYIRTLMTSVPVENKSIQPEKKPLIVSTGTAVPVRPLNSFTLYTPSFEHHSRASIKIEDGCNNDCAYCRIHLARGKAVSLSVEEIVRRVQELERRGVQEVVFTGVNLSQYAGLAQDGSIVSFAGLLDVLFERTDTIRFRVSSFYPQHITPALCERLASGRIQPSFHLSIQSGSDRILRLMRRPYDRDDVLNAVNLLRQVKEKPFLSCDIIAGFPSETQEDFAFTQSLCNEADFAWIHAFPFSPRPGTPAFTMKPQIPERIKGERVRWLTDTAVAGKLAYIQSFVGKELYAVAERSRSQRKGGVQQMIHAVTDNFLHVECPAVRDVAPGSLVKVRITAAMKDSILAGKEIECSGELDCQ